MSPTPLFSIVSPVYLGEKIVPELVKQIEASVSGITPNYEIILVEDGSPDESWQAIEKVCSQNLKVKGIKLSRNFGQHYAITAGLESAKGEWMIVMDCDLQDVPAEIPNLYKKAQEGYDIVLAQRVLRQDPFLKKIFSSFYYITLGYFIGRKIDKTVANFGIYNKNVIKAIKSTRDKNRIFPILVQWTGFKVFKLPVKHGERFEGKSSYNFKKLTALAFDIILSNSDKPLKIAIKFGFIITFISLLFVGYSFIMYMTGKITVSGYASIIISLWLIAGIIITLLGVVGLYIGKIFEAVKDRPVYIIQKQINL